MRDADARLDALCREYVLKRDRVCQRCGTDKRLQWSHVYTRTYRCIRWNPLNSVALCAGCHLWWHAHPIDAVDWFKEKFGDDRVVTLRALMRARGKVDQRLQEIWFTQEIQKLSSMEGFT